MADEAVKEAPVEETKDPIDFGDEGYWDGVLADLEAGAGNFLFFKEGRTRLRLLAPPGAKHPSQLFAMIQQEYRGRMRPKYIFYCYKPEDATNPEIPDDQLVKIAVAPKTLWKSIVTMIKEGYTFFGDDAHGVVCVRSGTGLNSDYQAMPSPKPVPLDAKVTAALGKRTIKDAMKEWDDFQKSRAQAQAEGDTEPSEEGKELADGW